MNPVIIDTDFGTDLDDHWAVLAALAAPELDVRLISLCSGDPDYRARLLSEMLVATGRTDVPVVLGEPTTLRSDTVLHTVPERAGKVDLTSYPGSVSGDAAGAMVDAITSSEDPVTVVAIGPSTNLAAALKRDPSITDNSRLLMMAGWIRGGEIVPGVFAAPARPQLEYNIESDIEAFRTVLESDWEITLSPIDSCGKLFVNGDRYLKLRQSSTAPLNLLFDTYREWLNNPDTYIKDESLIERSSSPLCDTLPLVHSYREDFSLFEDLKLAMTDDGVLGESGNGRAVRVATGWHDLEGFLDHLTGRLLEAGSDQN